MQIARVALDLPLHRFFDYLVPASEVVSVADVGCRVAVPFGRRAKIGILVKLATASEIPVAQLKSIIAVLRDLPALPPEWFRLCEFCAAYYQVPLGEVMLSTLPAGLRRIDPPKARSSRRIAPAPAAQEPPALTT
jgi:primosomal protein N' (replication factor Y)